MKAIWTMLPRTGGLLLGAAALLVLTGCGRDSAPDPTPAPSPEPTAGSPVDATPTSAAEPTPVAQPDTPTAPSRAEPPEAPPSAPPEAPDVEGAADDPDPRDATEQAARAERATILALEQQAAFGDAFLRARDLSAAHPALRATLELNELLRRLRDHRVAASELNASLDKLTAESELERRVAVRQFDRAGITGALVLRRVVREREDALAAVALEALHAQDPLQAAVAAAERLHDRPATALRDTCLARVEAGATGLGLDGTRALCRAAWAQGDAPDARRLRALAARGLVTGVDEGALARTWVQLAGATNQADATAEVRYLGTAFHYAADRDAARFAALIDRAAALAELRDRAAAQAPSLLQDLFGPVDAAALDRALVGRWTFGSDKWPFMVEDLEGGYEQDNVTVRRTSAASTVHRSSYAVAAWLRPDTLPSGEQPDPFGCVLRKAGWAMSLVIGPDGHITFMHFLDGRADGVVCRSAEPVAPGAWVHVAAQVDRAAGRATLHVDGVQVAESTFTAGAPVSREEDATRPFRVLGLEPGETTGCRFPGDVDDIRLYERTLTDTDVTMLRRVGRVWD